MSALEKFLISDRQWQRMDRIAHAKYQLRNATKDADRTFWEAVLKANAAYEKH